MKEMILHSTQIVQVEYKRLLLSLCIVRLRCIDFVFHSNYLQSAKLLQRDIFVLNPSEDFEISNEECFSLAKLPHGLYESGELWYETLDAYLRTDLAMKPIKTDPALYIRVKNGRVIGSTPITLTTCYEIEAQSFETHAILSSVYIKIALRSIREASGICKGLSIKWQGGVQIPIRTLQRGFLEAHANPAEKEH
eukprot:IDg6602t1